MRKSILSAIALAALLCLTCGDSGTNSRSSNPDGSVDAFAGKFHRKQPGDGGTQAAKYQVTVSSAGTGASGGGNYAVGTAVTISAGTAPSGQQFKNWTTTSNGVTFANANSATTTFTMLANAVTVTANFETAVVPPTTFTVTFNINYSGGSNPTNATTGTDGKLATLPTPTRSGYTLAGWFTAVTGGTQVTTSTVFSANATIYAQWTEVPANSYTVTWNAAGGSPAPTQATVTAGGSITAPAAMTKTGYSFGGWYANSGLTGTAVTFPVTGVTVNREYWAKWMPESYTITYTLGGGTATPANPTSYTIESATIMLNNPTRTGYNFTGWTGSNGVTAQATVTISTGSTGNKSYTATWTEVPVNSYTVTWNAAGGSPVPTQTSVTEDGSITAPAAMTKTGYVFDAWYTTSTFTAASKVTFPVTGVTEAKTFYARWKAVYTVTFNTNYTGGTVSPASAVTDTSGKLTLTALPTPTRTGYAFDGWFTTATGGGMAVTLATVYTAATTIYAQWTADPVSGGGKGTFIDSRGGGTTYKYVTIGGKKWMAENLNYDTANTVGSWCYYNESDNCAKYGRLYNWNTAMAGSTSSIANPNGVRGVCPEGWHLPSRAEWGELAIAAGGTGTYGASGTAGKALKSTSGG
jgi:uncharacterized repeat protein (TIGR02543 family)